MFSAHILKFLSQEHSLAEHELEREMCEFAYLIIIYSGVEKTIFEFTSASISRRVFIRSLL